MLAVRASFGEGRYGAGVEQDVVLSTTHTPAAGRQPLVWCHGNYGTAAGDFVTYSTQLRLLAQRFTVVAADLGGNTFGNDTGVTRVGQVLDYLASTHGLSQPAVLVGASMGGVVALNYAVRFPARVRAVVGIIPALSLDVPETNPAADEIDLAYPPAYDPANPDHLAHDPVAFAGDLPDDLPIALWTSSNDPVCVPAATTAFLNARPQTMHTNLGAHGHGGIDVAMPLVADWLKGV